MKNDPIEAALAALDHLRPETSEGKKAFAKALAGKSNLVAAKAARILGGSLDAELLAELAAAFLRFLEKGSSADKGCTALTALARTLVKLDHDDADLFRRGMKHVQMEGTWGGSEDTAAELRAVCATGLANTRDPRKLRDLVELLVDREWPARAGAVRAIAAVGSDASSLLLRFKALSGDAEPEVLSECLTGLLDVDGAEALPLVTSIARSARDEVAETAVLALGASRRADAIEWLKERFEEVADREKRKCILLALASSRTEAAIAFLLDVIHRGSATAADLAVAAMSIHRADAQLWDAVTQALESRS